MEKIRSLTSRLVHDEQGLTTVEYGIVLALVAVLALGVWNAFGTNVGNSIKDSNTEFQTQVSGATPITP